MNKVTLQGNAGRDPQVLLTQSGKEIMTFSLATSTSWKGSDGEWQTHTDWHRVTVFKRSTLSWLKTHLKKGSKIYLEGTLSYHEWKDKYGQSRVTSHVIITGQDGKVIVLDPLYLKEELDVDVSHSDDRNRELEERDALIKDFQLSAPDSSVSGSPVSDASAPNLPASDLLISDSNSLSTSTPIGDSQ